MKLGSEKNQLHFAILTFTNFHEWWNEHLLFLSCAQCIFKAKKLILVRNSLFLQGWGKKCSVIVITHYLICPFLVTNDKIYFFLFWLIFWYMTQCGLASSQIRTQEHSSNFIIELYTIICGAQDSLSLESYEKCPSSQI